MEKAKASPGDGVAQALLLRLRSGFDGAEAELPAPVVDLRGIHANCVGVVLVLLDLILHPLLDVGGTGTEGLDAIDHVDHQVEPVDLVIPVSFLVLSP